MLTKRHSSSEQIYYYHTDHLGTPIMLTDSNQAIAWDATYEPFGKASITVSSVTNNLRFPGQYYDMETGLHYNWNRYYWPEVGRYVEADLLLLPYFELSSFIPAPLSESDTYLYAKSNPLIYLDLFGLLAECVYSITAKNISCTQYDYTGCARDKESCYAESGDNDPNHQNISKIGPVPVGRYTMDPPEHRRPGWVHFYPLAGTNTYGRSGFAIHSGTRTEGCILITDRRCLNRLLTLLAVGATPTTSGTLKVTL